MVAKARGRARPSCVGGTLPARMHAVEDYVRARMNTGMGDAMPPHAWPPTCTPTHGAPPPSPLPARPQAVEDYKRQREEEEMGNAMKALENRTLDSKREMDIMAALDEMRSLKARHNKVSTEDALAALGREAERQGGQPLDPDELEELREFYQLRGSSQSKQLAGAGGGSGSSGSSESSSGEGEGEGEGAGGWATAAGGAGPSSSSRVEQQHGGKAQQKGAGGGGSKAWGLGLGKERGGAATGSGAEGGLSEAGGLRPSGGPVDAAVAVGAEAGVGAGARVGRHGDADSSRGVEPGGVAAESLLSAPPRQPPTALGGLKLVVKPKRVREDLPAAPAAAAAAEKDSPPAGLMSLGGYGSSSGGDSQ